MLRYFLTAWLIMVIGAVVLVSTGCGGGGGDESGPSLPDRLPPVVVGQPDEMETARESFLPMPDMPIPEGPEEAAAEPVLPVSEPDAPAPKAPVPEAPAAAVMDAPGEADAAPEPPVATSPPPRVHLDAAPVVTYRGRVHVGADVAPVADQVTASGMHGATAVSYGRVRDGVGADEVIAYLREHAEEVRQHAEEGDFKFDPSLVTFPAPPTVRLAEGTADELADFVVLAVRLINAALPHDRRLRFGDERVTPLQPMADVPDGEIVVDFAPWEDWNDPDKPPQDSAAALAQWARRTIYDGETGERLEIGMRAGRVWVDRDAILTAWVRDNNAGRWQERVLPRRLDDSETLEKWYSDQDVVAVLIHELLHTLGMGVHLDAERFPDSIMNEHRGDYDGITGHVLFPLDREALQAAYSVLEPGVLPDELAGDLGAWEDVSLHLRGEIDTPGEGAFGVAVRNGLAQPWADGRMPGTTLADNRRLSGTASWSGRLLGFTTDLQAVGGAADLWVELESLAGQLDFSGLEHWPADTAPGPVGSGAPWGDGDLRYQLSVSGNTFEQTGGDAGTVTGAFFGQAHEAMGGVLERSDLSAAFGGSR